MSQPRLLVHLFLCSYRKKDASGWRVTVPSRRQLTTSSPMSVHLPTASLYLQDALDKHHISYRTQQLVGVLDP